MTEARILLTGLVIGESPRWHQGRLWFANWGAGEMVAVDAGGRREVIARVPGFGSCLDWLPDGRLLVTGGGTVRRVEPDGSLAVHADLSGLGCHMLNEIVVDGRGNIYLNDIGFNLMSGAPAAPGCVVLLSPDGSARRVAEGLMFPNGMAITPDNRTLIVAESYEHRLTAFDIGPDGSLSNRRTWAEVPSSAPDGICLDAEGAVWYADVPNRHCLRVREGGQVLQSVQLDRGGFACMLGGADRRTLYILAAEWKGAAGMAGGPPSGQLLAVEAPAPGVGWP
jgi:sugar lactone lactonase YvrE